LKITNKRNLSLPLAVLFSHSDYDASSAEKTISATSIMKPLRSIILQMQNTEIQSQVDLVDMIPSVFGSAVHSFAEQAWRTPSTMRAALSAMGIPLDTQKRVIVNPDLTTEDIIPIYIERRTEKEIAGWTIRGKFDCCVDGKLADYKTTSVWATIFGSNDEDYKMQGSIYRWLNQDIVTADTISIEKIYTDWSATKARQDSKYPQCRAESIDIQLLSVQATKSWLSGRLVEIDKLLQLNQDQLPMCSNDELWSSDSKWKYYKKPGAARATKVYSTSDEANQRLATEGTGEVIHFPGQVKRCNYCNVQPICTQAQALINEGRLEV